MSAKKIWFEVGDMSAKKIRFEVGDMSAKKIWFEVGEELFVGLPLLRNAQFFSLHNAIFERLYQNEGPFSLGCLQL